MTDTHTYLWGIFMGIGVGLNLANIITMTTDKIKAVYSIDLNKDSKNEIVVSHQGKDKVFFPQSDGTYKIADEVFEDLKEHAELNYNKKLLVIETDMRQNLADLVCRIDKNQSDSEKKALVQKYKIMYQDAKKAYKAEIKSLDNTLKSYENGGK